jgi:hypothetical protein
MEGHTIDFSSTDTINRGHGRPAKVTKHHTTVRVQQRCQELKAMLRMAYQEQQLLIAKVVERRRVLAETKLESQREMDEIKLQETVLKETSLTAAALLMGEKEQVETAIEEASVPHNFLRADIVTNVIHILDESGISWTRKFSVKK